MRKFWRSTAGWTAASGRQALQRIASEKFDVIVTDVRMDDLDGLELLRRVRERDLDLPVILITGAPNLESAIRAVEYGAIRYLAKPIDLDHLRAAVLEAANLGALARLKREALTYVNESGARIGDRAGLEVRFAAALRGIWIAWQPIVSWSGECVVAYEALVRSTEPELGHPGALFDAAERLGLVQDLGRVIRRRIADAAQEAPGEADLFVNLHPSDLLDPELSSADAQLAKFSDRVVFEISERASLEHVDDPSKRVTELRQLGYRIAVDDLGAGYAGLTSLAQLHPEIVKLDMSLVRGVAESETKQRLIRSMVALCREMGVLVVVEGVETGVERDHLLRLGCDLLQGYRRARADVLGLEDESRRPVRSERRVGSASRDGKCAGQGDATSLCPSHQTYELARLESAVARDRRHRRISGALPGLISRLGMAGICPLKSP
jgi:EAL domain-containing protein (putative c-di-GMP-specific phosphodiesterase class I)